MEKVLRIVISWAAGELIGLGICQLALGRKTDARGADAQFEEFKPLKVVVGL